MNSNRSPPTRCLSKYPGPFGTVADEIKRVASVEVLREDQNPDVRLLGAYLLRGAQAIVGVPGRHLDVGDDHVGLVGAGLADQVGRVGSYAGDLEPRLLEDRHDPFENQRLILSDDHPHRLGITHAPTLRHPPHPMRLLGLTYAPLGSPPGQEAS